MRGEIIIAPEYKEITGPLIFLAGPIQGAEDWQSRAVGYLQQVASEPHIASPRRPLKHEGEFPEQMYAAQVDWETHYLRRAASQKEDEKGVILFWLAKEIGHSCNHAHGQTTRFELAEWKMHHEKEGTQLVVGIEEGFTGARYICRRFDQDCPEVPILSTLEETCERAAKMCYKR
ncbi:hypothetical protein HYX13_05025 [Candidatus Woesearchaeota archaeon]|nr:hypothetical protein [Candidatus Woesearchaeota archaeon]